MPDYYSAKPIVVERSVKIIATATDSDLHMNPEEHYEKDITRKTLRGEDQAKDIQKREF